MGLPSVAVAVNWGAGSPIFSFIVLLSRVVSVKISKSIGWRFQNADFLEPRSRDSIRSAAFPAGFFDQPVGKSSRTARRLH
jgi:hypothetical protein